MVALTRHRERIVAEQIAADGARDRNVLDAMSKVRHVWYLKRYSGAGPAAWQSFVDGLI